MRALTLLALVACGGSDSTETPASAAKGPDPAAAEIAAGRLCTLFERVKEECTTSGPAAAVGDHTYTLSAEITNEVKAGSAYSLELQYDVAVDGKAVPGLRGRAVGGGPNREAALEQAADDWARVFGVGIVDHLRHTGRLNVLQSLQDEQTPPPAFVAGEWVAYPGYTDLRGKRTEDKTIDIQAVLKTLEPAMNTWGGGSHGVYIQFTRAGTAYNEQSCTLDGLESPEVCTLIQSYDWPQGGYLLKQYFAFAEGPLPEDVTARPELPELDARGE